ncbi:diguanylate cyclase AdrA, partial [Pseudomonas sp. P7759]|uniref:MASE2 domain-containing protein n=1 Tax=Pseudomonas sp. P7759 TaxID=2738831 RepID=UPI00180DEF70
MSAAEGTGLPLASRLYKSRTLGLTLGFVCVVFGMYPLAPAWWVWAWMVLNAFAWPHMAFQLTLRS